MKELSKHQALIRSFQESIDDITELLINERSLSVLYINCMHLNTIENHFGKKIFMNILKDLHTVLLEMKGRIIRIDDIIVFNESGVDEFIIFLSKKRERKNFHSSDIEVLCSRVTEHLNDRLFPITFPFLKARPKIEVGYSIVIYNPMMREERLIKKLIDDAKVMADYQKFKRVMRNKEKLQELILKETIHTVFQPIVDFTAHKIIGYEALSRGPEGSEYEHPFVLFDAAAESELMFELDRLCRKKALQNANGMKPGHKLFLNCLPSAVMDHEFRNLYLESFVDELKLKPINIVLEITEREAVEHYDLFKKTASYYSDLGFAIAIDDIGSGYSSLETVVELKPDYVKVDNSLIRSINENILKQELLKAIKNLSDKMGSTVVAEGIETEEELDTLRQIGIQTGQGFLFARPSKAFVEVFT